MSGRRTFRRRLAGNRPAEPPSLEPAKPTKTSGGRVFSYVIGALALAAVVTSVVLLILVRRSLLLTVQDPFSMQNIFLAGHSVDSVSGV